MHVDLMRIVRGVFVLAVATLLPVAVSAQSVADIERRLLPFQRGSLAPLPASFWESLALLRSEEDKQNALKADIQFGLSGDEAGEKSLYKLNTGISLTRGNFPSELTVQSKLGLQLRDGVLQEDVTSLLITYDYHATNTLEYFAFAERFTDNFLSIQQRYEIGFGARLAAKMGSIGDAVPVTRGIDGVNTGFTAIRSVGAASASDVPLSASDLERFDKSVGNLRRAMLDKDAKLTIGLAASLFAEIERADLDVVSVPAAGTATDSIKSRVSLRSEQRYRLSVRPTLRWRLTRDVKVQFFPYFKLPLDAPRRVTTTNGDERLDYRRDIFTELTWSVPQAQTGLENVEFALTYNHYFDNLPPSLTAATIAAELARGRVFSATEAEGSHRVVVLSLRLRW